MCGRDRPEQRTVADRFHPHEGRRPAAQLIAEGHVMRKYQCQVCGYIYDPEKGDPTAKIKAETDFPELPADWICPVCSADKDQFEPL